MKNTILLTIICLLLAVVTHAQAPQGIPYQASARNSSGTVLASTAISVRFSIRDNTTTGAILYRETHSTTTDANGMFSVNVGQGTPILGTFAGINWGTNAKYMQVELDPAGGSSYIDMGTQQMMSVPYALNAGALKLTVSATGDTLYSGNGNYVIIPGISSANCIVSAGTITGTATVTAGSTTTLSNATTGGAWSSSATGIATVGSTGIVTGVAAGTATISYTVTNGCGSAVATQVVTVNASLIGATYGGGKIAYIYVAGDPGYVAGETHGIIAAPSDQSTGIRWYNGSYITTGATGTALGTGMANTNAIVTAQGAGSYAAKLCSDLVLNGYSDWYLPSRDELQKIYINRSSIGGFTTGNYWSSSENGAANAWYVNFNFGPAYYTNKDYTVYVRAVRAFSYPEAISGTSTVCVGSATTLTSATTGGTWSSSNTGVATVSSSGVVSGVSAGTATISYTATGSFGTGTTTRIVTVNPLPSSGTITGTATVCAGSTTALSNATTGGTWSSSATGVATVGSTGVVTGVAAGTTTISYTVTNSCGSATATSIITVNALPSVDTITGTASVTAGSTTALSNTTTGGTWSSSATGIATVGSTGLVTGVAAGTATISYTVTNTCGSAVATQVVTVNAALTIGATFGGGKIAYILVAGDPGYVAGETHGLIAAPSDQSTGIQWGCSGTTVGGTSTALGTGAANTAIVSAACGAGTAAKLCDDLVLNGYSDWYLPSRDELQKLYINRSSIGGFAATAYWSSSEGTANHAWYFYFFGGATGVNYKFDSYYVRAVRAF